MHIHDFYSKLTSGTEGGKLFEALRNLRSVESFRLLLEATADADWPAWSVAVPIPGQA